MSAAQFLSGTEALLGQCDRGIFVAKGGVMQTCHSCLSSDIPDGATHCRHCGRRLKPSRAPLIVIISIVAACGLWWAASAIRSVTDRDASRERLKIERDSILSICGPHPSEASIAVIDDATQTFRAHVSASPLDPIEQEQIEAGFENQLEVRGCGWNARNQLKRQPGKRRSPPNR